MKRSARLVEITHYLLSKPHTLIPLGWFAERYDSAKSSISEDLSIIKEVLESEGNGELLTLTGATGGVKYVPKISYSHAKHFIESICRQLEQPERLLPGGYLYMSDLIGQPAIMNEVGRIFATHFADRPIDVIMTVETKGIPLAYVTGSFLNLPVVIVRRDPKVTEGSSVSINYISGSNKRINTMTLARRALKSKSNVLIIDDFMRAGGTITGMIDLLQEFEAKVQGVGVLVEAGDVNQEEQLIKQYISLAKLEYVDSKTREIRLTPGNYFQEGSL